MGTRHQKLLIALGCLALVGGGVAIVATRHATGGSQSSTFARIHERTDAGLAEFRKCIASHSGDFYSCSHENHAFVALARALDEVYLTLRDKPHDRDAALDRARDKLTAYYKPDEAEAFELYADEGVYVLYAGPGKQSVWLGRDARQLIIDPAKLPPGARQAIGLR